MYVTESRPLYTRNKAGGHNGINVTFQDQLVYISNQEEWQEPVLHLVATTQLMVINQLQRSFLLYPISGLSETKIFHSQLYSNIDQDDTVLFIHGLIIYSHYL